MKQLSRWLISVTRPVLPPLALSTLARIANQSLGIVLYLIPIWALMTWATGGYDRLGPVLAWVAGLMIATALVKALLRYAEHYLGHWVAFQALELLRIRVFRDIYPQAPALVSRVGKDAVGTGDILSRLTRDIGQVEVFFAHTLAPVVSAVVVPTAVVIMSAFISPWHALLMLGIFLVVALISLDRTAYKHAETVTGIRGRLAQHVADSAGGVAEVVGYGAQARRHKEMEELEAPLEAGTIRRGRINGQRVGAVAGLRMGVFGLMLLPPLLGADVSIPVTVALTFAVVRCWDMIQDVSDLGSALSNSLAAARRVYELSHAGLQLADGPSTLTPTGPGPAVTFGNVTFTYPDSPEPAIQDVSLSVEPGSWTAVVGTTGSGKSTLSRLLLRWWDVTSGQVLIDGVPVDQYVLDDLRAAVGIVTQDIRLMHTSVADNLRLALPDATDSQLWEALHVAALDEEIKAMPDGLDTVVGEGGTALSGGQRQRLSLAQALLRGGRVLILDEFTAHLNPQLAAEVQSRLGAARPGVTVLEITHVLDNIDSADWVAVMDSGRILEQGAPRTLRASDGALAHLLGRDVTS